jgi:lipopolysaccharide/colanic/teichoic acid biosynthesis glycosyltransferase
MPHKVNSYYSSASKLFFDYTFAFLIIPIVVPLVAFISLFVFITAGWPIFFVQKRTGKGGKPFSMYKFRTMYRNAHRQQKKLIKLNQAPGPMFKIFEDPRFVGIGRFLSGSGLDELPQIFNILKGEMSFVGPRPLPVNEAKQLSAAWEFRTAVKPGIFSEWTLAENRHNSLTDWKELDRLTVSNGGMQYDLKIIIVTLIKNSVKITKKTR